jgi:Rps23 Pro-64 3,4-dihydroxylase Tpa1-like proline 4-hydroxylase
MSTNADARMTSSTSPLRIAATDIRTAPFVHAIIPGCIEEFTAERLLAWLETTEQWRLVETDFYEQYEFSLFDCDAEEARLLTDELTVSELQKAMGAMFGTRFGPDVSIVAHKLLEGQHIGIHNDYLGDGETHRLTVQLNRGLHDEDGGFFMMFSSNDPQDVSDIYRPVHRSAVAFAISPDSYHAVSKIHGNVRFTIVISLHELDR